MSSPTGRVAEERAERLRRARAYPFERHTETGGFALHAGTPLAIEGGRLDLRRPGDTCVRQPASGQLLRLSELATAEELRAPRVPVLAVGSNASPAQLARKLVGLPGHLVLAARARARGLACVYSAHFASYGSIPATLERCEGAETEVFALWLSEAQLRALHASEALGVSYRFAQLEDLDLRLEDGQLVQAAGAYLSLHGALAPEGEPIALREIPSRGVPWRQLGQPEVLELAHAALRPSLEVELDLDDFIDALARDSRLRAACAAALRERFGRPLAASC